MSAHLVRDLSVSFSDTFEYLCSVLRAVLVRVILQSQLPIRSFDLLLGGLGIYSEADVKVIGSHIRDCGGLGARIMRRDFWIVSC